MHEFIKEPEHGKYENAFPSKALTHTEYQIQPDYDWNVFCMLNNQVPRYFRVKVFVLFDFFRNLLRKPENFALKMFLKNN